MISTWEETFPAIDVRACLKRIKLWNEDNPTKRKTKTGIKRHISAWLEKEQNKGRASTFHKESENKPDPAAAVKAKVKEKCGSCYEFKRPDGCMEAELTDEICDRFTFDPSAIARGIIR